MMPPEALTVLLFVFNGFLATFLGQWWLGMASIAYGTVDALLDECEHGSLAHECAAGLFYDAGLLQFFDTYLQRLLALSSLVAFLFKHGLVRAFARSVLSTLAFVVTSSDRISTNEGDLIGIGTYLALLGISRVTGQQPERQMQWVAASLAVYLMGFGFQQLAVHSTGTPHRVGVCFAHVFFAMDVLFVSLALQPSVQKR
jgi:hypothetical protein